MTPHEKYVSDFLLEMYQTMIDPVEEFSGNIEQLCELLLKRAQQDRELSDIIHHAEYLYSDFATEARLRKWRRESAA